MYPYDQTVLGTNMTMLGKRLILAAGEARTIARGEAAPGSFKTHFPVESDAARKPLDVERVLKGG
ncbi:MAG: hypothetical protein U1E67_04230 [Hyphomicrobiales bacterium]